MSEPAVTTPVRAERSGLAPPRAHAIARRAVLSLYNEVSLYPKPGLVSPVDAGSHADMHYQMFVASLNSLRGYFTEIAALGAAAPRFAALQRLGLAAERRMLATTGGVNTHRGAIFNLGLLCAAAGYLEARQQMLSPVALGATIRAQWGAAILAAGAVAPPSHGRTVERRYGVSGARSQAAAGFPTVREFGLPAYRAALAATADRERAAVQALFAIMAQLDDTNLVWRGGPEGLAYAQREAGRYLAAGGVLRADWRADAVAVHHKFVARNLSPGGAADLLGVTLFVDALCG